MIWLKALVKGQLIFFWVGFCFIFPNPLAALAERKLAPKTGVASLGSCVREEAVHEQERSVIIMFMTNEATTTVAPNEHIFDALELQYFELFY